MKAGYLIRTEQQYGWHSEPQRNKYQIWGWSLESMDQMEGNFLSGLLKQDLSVLRSADLQKKKTVQLLYNLARTSKLREIVKDGRAGRAAVHGVAKSRIRLRNGTTATNCRRHCTYWHSSKLSNTFCVVVINPVFSFLHAFWGQHTQGWSGSAGSLRASQVALVVKNPPADAGDKRHAGSIPGSGRSPGGGHGSPLQCSCLENPMHRRAWWATVHGVAKSQTRLNRWSTHAGNLKSNTMEI